jgi:hypothetical protein
MTLRNFVFGTALACVAGSAANADIVSVGAGLPADNYVASSSFAGSAQAAFNGGSWNSGGNQAWLEVDLGRSETISSITITNPSGWGGGAGAATSVSVSDTPLTTGALFSYPAVYYSEDVLQGGTHTLSFTPVTGEFVRIDFSSIGTYWGCCQFGQGYIYHIYGQWIALDGITVDAVAAVPEPATWAMMLLGFCGVGFMLRKSRRLQVVATTA